MAVVMATWLVQGLGRTWRIDRRGIREVDRELQSGARCIYAFWHARLLPLVYTHRGRGIVVLVSRHRDGEWMARILERLGYSTARGSSTRGGEQGVRGMLSGATEGHSLGITPDGPRGPARRVKAGVVYLASRTGLPVLPLAFAADRAWVLRSWDRFRVPKPFARVVVAYGERLEVPADLDPASAERWRARLEQAIDEVTQRVIAAAGEPPLEDAGPAAPSGEPT